MKRMNEKKRYESAKFLLDIAKLAIAALIFGSIVRQDFPPMILITIGVIISVACIVGAMFLLNDNNDKKD